MKLSQYKYIVTIEKQDFRSHNKEKTTFRRRGFQTFSSAEKYLLTCRSSSYCYNGWILNMAQVHAAVYVQRFLENNPRSIENEKIREYF